MTTHTCVVPPPPPLPQARVIYCSATGVSEIRNMAYASRLGLWGPSTSFETFVDFEVREEDRDAAGAGVPPPPSSPPRQERARRGGGQCRGGARGRPTPSLGNHTTNDST